MKRDDLEQLSKDELIEAYLALQSSSSRPRKTSRTSSLPPSTDKKAKRANSKPGGGKSGHKAHFRTPGDTPDTTINHRPSHCNRCGFLFGEHAPTDLVGAYDLVDLPRIKPLVEQHRRLACTCSCGARTVAPLPDAAKVSPFGPGVASLVVYLKSFQLFSYERLQKHLADVFGLKISQGGIMNIIKRANRAFEPEYQAIVARIEQVGDEALAFRLKLWMGDVFRLANGILDFAKSTIKTKVRDPERRIDNILLWEGVCEETGKVVRKFRKARDQLLVFTQAPELVDATNNKSERALRPAVIMRKVTNGFRAKWAADADCRVRTVVDTAKLSGASPYQTVFSTLSA